MSEVSRRVRGLRLRRAGQVLTMSPLAILPSALENSVGALIASFRSSIPCPPMPLFYASLAVSRQQQRQTRGRAARYSFLVGLFHPLLRTGLSRRSLRRLLHVCQRSVSKSYTCFWCRAHDRRRLLHFNVTAHPTAEWTGQQLREAFPFDQLPRYLLRDRDAIFGNHFREQVRDLGISEVLSAPRSPWQRAYRERVIGTIRRECLDHVIVFHENALRRTLHSYFDYYHRSRTHLSLGKDSPEPRAIQPPEMGSVVALPQVGGLHHRYERRAA